MESVVSYSKNTYQPMNEIDYDGRLMSLKLNCGGKAETIYELKQNLIDPSKSSPPNEFMRKLYKRFQEQQSGSCNSLNKSLSATLMNSSPLSASLINPVIFARK